MQRMAERIFHAIGRPELVDDPRFRTNDERLIHRDALDEIISEFIARRSRAENLSLFEAAGVTVGPVLSVAELIDHPYVVGREVLVEATWPRIVADAQCRYSFVRNAGIDKMGAPAIDQDRDAILAELNERSVEKQRKTETGKPTLAS